MVKDIVTGIELTKRIINEYNQCLVNIMDLVNDASRRNEVKMDTLAVITRIVKCRENIDKLLHPVEPVKGE